MKRVLLLCASHNDLGLIKALRKMGYYIIVTGNKPGLIGEKYADEYVMADYSQKEKILQIAIDYKIDAICQCCNDFGVYTAAYVAEKLGLPGYDSYETTLLLHNKDKFKEFAKENGIISPISTSFTDIDEAFEYIKTVSYPIIVKPTDASAGNGISKAENVAEAERSVELAFQKSRAGRIVIEPYIAGTQHGFCTFLINQKVVAWCSNNEYSFLNPYRVEIDTYPADNYERTAQVLVEQIEKIASLLQLKDGIFHLQYIFDGEKPQIIEVMRRVLGNMYSVPANMLNNMDWDYWEAKARCGLSLEAFPNGVEQEGYYAYKSVLATQNGQIKSINIPQKYQKYLVGQCMLKDEGQEVENYMSEPIGFLFFMFQDKETMHRILIEEYVDNLVLVE